MQNPFSWILNCYYWLQSAAKTDLLCSCAWRLFASGNAYCFVHFTIITWLCLINFEKQFVLKSLSILATCERLCRLTLSKHILEAYSLYLNSDSKKVSLKGLLTDISTHGFFACKTATRVCILSNKSICFRLLKGTFELLDNFRSLHYYHLLFLTFWEANLPI